MMEIMKGCFITTLITLIFIYLIIVIFKHKKTKILLSVITTIFMGLCLTSYIFSINYYYTKQEENKTLVQQEKESQTLKEQEFIKIENEKQRLFDKEQQLILQEQSILQKFSDYYFDCTKQDYDDIQDDVFDWGSHSFVVKKNDNDKYIEFSLIENNTNNVIKVKIKQY